MTLWQQLNQPVTTKDMFLIVLFLLFGFLAGGGWTLFMGSLLAPVCR